MAGDFNIGAGISLDGEADFKRAVKDINKEMTVLSSEMKKVTAQFADNANSMEALTAKHDVLNRKAEEQRNKIQTLTAALENAKQEYGENSRQVQDWQIQLNNAEADLARTESQVRQTAQQIDNFGQEAEEAGEQTRRSGEDARAAGDGWAKLGDIMKGAAVAAGAVVIAATAAALKVGQEVVKQFGELEQNLGGSEAVFGEYAARIQKTGEDAYRNLGISQSEYLATANKMGALFQGSGVEQQRSLELTEKSMQRAADMASVMGVDMNMAMESVAGAAKGNYTMMDNLGVAMNETTLKAYALSKGLDYGEVSKDQSQKAELAMQMFLEKTAQYEGNFAREATQTVTGSLGLLQAALGSFTAGLGNKDADMTNLTQNLVDAFQAVVTNVTPIIDNLTKALPQAFSAVLGALGGIAPSLLSTVATLFGQVIGALIGALPSLIPVAVGALTTLVNALVENLPLLVESGLVLITSLADGLVQSLPTLIPAIVETVVTIVEGLIDNVDKLIDASIAITLALATGLIDALPRLIEKAPIIVAKLVAAFIENAPKLLSASVAIIAQITTGLVNGFGEILGKVGGWVDSNIAQPIKDKVSEFASIGGNLIMGVWNGISDKAGWLWGKVSGFFDDLTDRIKDFFGIQSPSRLFRDEIGVYLAQGVGVGFEQEMNSVAKRINNSIPTNLETNATVTATTRMGESIVNGLAPMFAMNQSAGGVYQINVNIDGKTAASMLFDPMRDVSRQRGVSFA